jgi:hypothetical protein
MEILPFRPFKVPKPADNAFFTPDNSANENFMIEDLARSGLVSSDLHSYTTAFIKKDGASAAYSIPYFGLDGKPLVDKDGYPVMTRTRYKLPEFSKEQRYTQPSGESLAKHNLPKTIELANDYIVCCEGEKKTAAAIKYLGVPAFGIGGCQMWRDPSGNGGLHPWIRKLLVGKQKVIIVPDGDVLRYDICNAYGTFAATLKSEGLQVEILNPPGKIDDLLVEWGPTARDRFLALPHINPEELVQSPVSLAKRHNLAFKQDKNGTVTVMQHTANVMRLMEEHQAFPKIWKNEDNNRIMIGDKEAKPGLTEMELANYFQYNLQFDKINKNIMIGCIEALAKKNSRSPMLEWIRKLEWDQTPRLESWLQRHWGAKDDAFTREVSVKWLVSAVARMEKPGTKIDWMLIVVGPQGTGKTSMPSILFRGHCVTMYGDHNDKDLHMLLHSALCVGFDELDSFGKRESSNLKAMITRNEDAFRPPYGASVEVFPRRFTLYGCGNRHEFLQNDPSGYRRYAVLEINKLLDFSGLEAERDQLWAEAYVRYRSGIKFWEVEGASQHAEEYVAPDPTEDSIINVLESWRVSKSSANVKDGYIYFTMSQLLTMIGLEGEGKNSGKTRDIAAILRKQGAERFMGSAPTGTIRGRYYRVPV